MFLKIYIIVFPFVTVFFTVDFRENKNKSQVSIYKNMWKKCSG